MATDDNPVDEPVIQPKAIRFLRDRPKLINFGVREDVLDEMDKVVSERRKPSNVAEQGVNKALETVNEAGGNVAKKRVATRLAQGNQSLLKNL